MALVAAAAILTVGLLAYQRVSDPGRPDSIVDLNYVSPRPLFFEDRTAVSWELEEAIDLADSWGYKNRDTWGGFVVRPEAVYLGVKGDPRPIIEKLRSKLDKPGLLRGFRAQISYNEVNELGSSIKRFVEDEFPAEAGRLAKTRTSWAMSRIVIVLNHGSTEMVQALGRRFGDKVWIVDAWGRAGDQGGIYRQPWP